MGKRQEWNLPAMADQELRALIARCNQKERVLNAPYSKARRSWASLRRQAERN